MIIIGITGSIGMGKTTISSMFRVLGIPVFDSDKQVKDILEKNIEIIDKIEKIWPEVVSKFHKKKMINKELLSNKIFRKKSERKILEKIIHPIVKNKRDKFIKKNDSSFFVGLDVPLLYETKTDQLCDYIFLVNTTKKIQFNRVLKRPNMTKIKFNQINSTQWSFERKKSKKPFIITTSYGKIFSFIIVLIYLLRITINSKVNNDKRISFRH